MPDYECGYCGVVGPMTDDHIPPESIYSRPLPPNLPTVKACLLCNGGASADDEYFRDTLLKHHKIYELPQAKQQVEKMIRAVALPAKQRYAEKTLRSFVTAEITTPAGLVIGSARAIKVDGARFARTATRYVRGLHRYEMGVRLPTEGLVVTSNPEGVLALRDDVLEAFHQSNRRVVQENLFWYAWRQFAEPAGAFVWLLVFFDAFPILASFEPEHANAASVPV